jgi:regulatory protein
VSPHRNNDSDDAPPWRVIEWLDPVRAPRKGFGTRTRDALDTLDSDEGDAPSNLRRATAAPAPSTPSDEAPVTPDPRRKALELLTRREHSRRELTRKLAARGVENATAQAVVDAMAENGWQDDARFAEALVRARVASGHGPIRIRAELQQHGLSSELIQIALDDSETDWNVLARALLQRRFGANLTRERKEIARRGAFLQRRGFDLESVRYALASGTPED